MPRSEKTEAKTERNHGQFENRSALQRRLSRRVSMTYNEELSLIESEFKRK